MRVEKFVILSFMEGMAISKKMVVSLAFNDPVRKVISNKLEMYYLPPSMSLLSHWCNLHLTSAL